MFAHMFMRFYVYLTKLLYKSPVKAVNMLVNMHFALPAGTYVYVFFFVYFYICKKMFRFYTYLSIYIFKLKVGMPMEKVYYACITVN